MRLHQTSTARWRNISLIHHCTAFNTQPILRDLCFQTTFPKQISTPTSPPSRVREIERRRAKKLDHLRRWAARKTRFPHTARSRREPAADLESSLTALYLTTPIWLTGYCSPHTVVTDWWHWLTPLFRSWLFCGKGIPPKRDTEKCVPIV